MVGYPHKVKGQGIYCYVTLMGGEEYTDDLKIELRNWVRQEIGPIASPDLIQWAPGLPKTRSGKIMRRILRKIAENDYSALGDTSTLTEPAVVDDLIENRMNRECNTFRDFADSSSGDGVVFRSGEFSASSITSAESSLRRNRNPF